MAMFLVTERYSSRGRMPIQHKKILSETPLIQRYTGSSELGRLAD